MSRYEVLLKETTYQAVTVEASSEEEARKLGFEKQFEDNFSFDGRMETIVDSVELIKLY